MGTSTISEDVPYRPSVSSPKRRLWRLDRAFWLVSFLIVLTDAAFVFVNYQGAREVMYQNLAEEGERQERTFALNLRTQGMHMQQTAAHIANQSDVRALFLAGREAASAPRTCVGSSTNWGRRVGSS